MKALIIFHSVTGCCYEIAHLIKDEFKNQDIKTDISCMQSFNQIKYAERFDYAKQYYSKIIETPQVSIDTMPDYDLLVFVSPTYFGNVSSEIKYVMDGMEKFWFDRSLKNMKFLGATCCATSYGGGGLTLQSMNTFAQHMGMKVCGVNDFSMPAYGLMHVAGEKSDMRPKDNEKLVLAIKTVTSDILNS